MKYGSTPGLGPRSTLPLGPRYVVLGVGPEYCSPIEASVLRTCRLGPRHGSLGGRFLGLRGWCTGGSVVWRIGGLAF